MGRNKGIRREYYLKEKLERAGYNVIRSAGSHTFTDLIAIHKEKKEILFVQCKKADSLSYFKECLREKKKEEEEYSWLQGPFEVKFIFDIKSPFTIE